MSKTSTAKNIKYLNTRERARYYALGAIDPKRRTDSDVEELVELEMKADRLQEREQAATNKRAGWEEG